MGESAVEALYPPDHRTVIAGQGTRPGLAKTVDGGYMLTGEWSFASGLKHGNYIHTLGIIEETGEPRIFVVPVDDAELFQDSWDVLGLKGTGSIDYNIDNVFVPEEYTHFAFTRDGSRGTSTSSASSPLPSCATRVGRWASVDACSTSSRVWPRPRPVAAGTEVDSDKFHHDFAEAEAKFRAARAFVMESWRDVEETFNADGEITVEQDTSSVSPWATSPPPCSRWPTSSISPVARPHCRRGPSRRCCVTCTQRPSTSRRHRSMWRNCGRELARFGRGQAWILLDLVEAH